jgi:hypothetical protein
MCGEAYGSWPLERIERLRAVLTRVLLERRAMRPAPERIFPPADDRGGL